MDEILLAAWQAIAVLVVGFVVCVWMSLGQRSVLKSISTAAVVAVWLALVVLELPVREYPVPPAEHAVLCGLKALRYFTLDTPFELLKDTAGLAQSSLDLYYGMKIFLSALAPICTAAAVFSALQMAGRLWVYLLPWRPVYYFSELNERSFTLARSIHDDWKENGPLFRKPFLVFCKVDSHDDGEELRFRSEARKLGAIFIRDPIYTIHKVSPWLRRVKVFLIDADESTNMGSALKMKKWISAPGRLNLLPQSPDSDLLIFSTQESAEMLFNKLLEDVKNTRISVLRLASVFSFLKALMKPADEALLKEAREYVDKTNKSGLSSEKREKLIRRRYRSQLLYSLAQDRFKNANSRIDLHLINETRLIAQKLLWEYPLYGAAKAGVDGKRRISLLIVGGGYMGMEILRTAMVSSVMTEYGFRAQVVDSAADTIREQFDHNYPYLPESVRYAVTFHKADVTDASFDRVLQAHCRDSTYVVVATGDDERNMVTAQFLRCWFARQSIEAGAVPEYAQQIYVAIRSSDRHESLVNLDGSGVKLFGCNTDVFSPEELLDRRMDRAAMMFNRCYDKSKLLLDNLCPSDPAKLKRIRTESKRDYYRLDSVDQLSNQLVALHTLYKLQDLLLLDHGTQAVRGFPKEQTEAVFSQLVYRMAKHQDTLFRQEHRRWEVFQAMCGWSPFPEKMILLCAKAGDPWQSKHKHKAAKLHGCLTPYDNLTGLAKTVNDTFGLTGDDMVEFLKYDRAMCVASLFVWLELVAHQGEAKNIRDKIMKPKERNNAEKNAADSDAVLARLCELFPQEEKTEEKEPVQA